MAHTSLTSLFSDIADAIRAKTGGSSSIVADDFPTAIAGINTSRYGETSAANSSDSSSISFTVSGEPTVFACVPVTDTGSNKTVSISSSTRIVTGVIKYGNNIYHGMQVGGGTSFALRISQVDTAYNNGTFTLTVNASNAGKFLNGVTYRLLYVY